VSHLCRSSMALNPAVADEFRTADRDMLATSIPRTEAHVIRHSKSGCLTGCLCRM
jgi:hypothetical protein